MWIIFGVFWMASQSNLIVHSSGSNPVTYQLDECTNDSALAQECNKDRLVAVLRTPRRLTGIGTSDESIVAYCQQEALPLLTTDWRLPGNEAASLSRANPGIVVVRSDSPRTMTTVIIMSVLSSFKSSVVNWHTLRLRNSIVELWPYGVYIRRAENSQVVDLKYLDFSEQNWQDTFVEIVRANYSRAD